MKFRFVTNLRPQTVASFENSGHQPMAWLLSIHRLTRQTESYALEAREQGLDLFADNGTSALIRQVVQKFAEPLAGLATEIRDLRRSLPDQRRIPFPREVPDELRRMTSDAAHAVLDEVDALCASASLESVLSDQLRMRPTHIIAKEHFGAACLLSLGLEREITGWGTSYFHRLNQVTIDDWQRVVADPRCRDVAVYATLSATDYNVARSVARRAAEQGVDRVAMGYAGINKDATFACSYWQGSRYPLPGSAPRRNIRGTGIALGIRDGYRDAGRPLRAFHALGLGATSQIPVLAACFDEDTEISMDATSPMYDSVNDRVFYDHGAGGDRRLLREIASDIVEGGDWHFDCPFCRYLRERFGHRPQAARDWWQASGRPSITRADLHPDEPLGAAIPTFASARGGDTAVQTRGRTGHNHWVLDRLAAAVPDSGRRQWGLARLDELASAPSRYVRWGVSAAREIIERAGD